MQNQYSVKFINRLQCSHGFKTAERILNTDYILYVHSGFGKYKIGSDTYKASAGDIFYCPAGIGNTIFADNQNPFCITGIEFLSCIRNILKDKILIKINILDKPFLISCIEEMIREYNLNRIHSQSICENILAVIIENLQRESAQNKIHTANIADEILTYISQNFRENITHEKLSCIFSYQKSTINRLLLKTTEMTLNNYLIDTRLKHSIEYLTYSSKTNAEIAQLCGYSSESYFIRQFKSKYGLTPNSYRKNINN